MGGYLNTVQMPSAKFVSTTAAGVSANRRALYSFSTAGPGYNFRAIEGPDLFLAIPVYFINCFVRDDTLLAVHLPYGFSSIKLQAVTAAGAQFGPPGYEVDLLYLACLATLVLRGSGPLAKDGLIRKRRKVRSS
jgi:hypothetical protein